MRWFYFVVFVLVVSVASAQQDTTRNEKKLTKADSTSQRINNKIDSIQLKANRLVSPDLSLSKLRVKKVKIKRKSDKDSVKFYKKVEAEKRRVNLKIDSLEKAGEPTEKYTRQLDSLDKVTYQKKDPAASAKQQKQKINSSKQKLTGKSDSLKGLNPASKYKSRLDSATYAPLSKVSNAQSKVSDAEQKLNSPVNKVEGVVNEKLSLMNSEGGAGANIPGSASLPDADINTSLSGSPSLPGTDLNTNLNLPQSDLKLDNPLNDQMGGVGEVKDKISDVKGLPQEQIGKMKSIDELNGAKEKLGEANVITDKAQAYGGDVKNIADGNLGEGKELPKGIESQASKIEGVQGIQKEAGAFDQYKDIASKGNDPEAVKAEVMKQASTMAVDHFAEKGEVLKATMDKVGKLKGKYSSLNGIENIPKRKPNEMKGKPFIERLTPGLTIQIQKPNDVWIDYNPYIGYRFYGKFTAGIGWNERVSVGKHVHFSFDERIYGPRVFADYKIGKGFSVRTDIEKMNAYVPQLSATGPAGDGGHRGWVWSAFVGLKKEYKFAGKVRGNAQFLYNLYDDHYNSPYTDRFAVRMGFEFPMKKKKPKPAPEAAK